MNRADFSDAALVLLGHGTTLDPQSSAPVYQHAAELRRRNLFATVRDAFWKQEPNIRKVLDELGEPRVFIVPLFISEGYFSEEAIPRELGFRKENEEGFPRMLRRGTQTFYYCQIGRAHV